MSPEQMRIRIAELLGYRWPGLREEKDTIGWMLDGAYIPRLPDFLNDLDAMHAAEETLTEDERKLFCLHLGPLTSQRAWDYIHLKAYNRALAFLKAKGELEVNAA